uniref:Uncharacterized protein n=1 Tax=Rhizophora mucronata TaxID=61149 RepID=A0A2P2N2Y3_RHIMU
MFPQLTLNQRGKVNTCNLVVSHARICCRNLIMLETKRIYQILVFSALTLRCHNIQHAHLKVLLQQSL